MNTIFQILIYTLYFYFAISALYVFVFAFLGKLNSFKIKEDNSTPLNKIAVLIPGYKEDKVIVNTVNNVLQQRYNKLFYDVIVIADSFETKTLNELKNLPIRIIEVSFEKSTKSKALNKALDQLAGFEYDIALILDADNHLHEDVLEKINTAYNQGYHFIQGHRVAKNTDTSFALLDAISEEINNNIYNDGPNSIGLSSRLVGSGMAFEFNFFHQLMRKIDAIGGFDKELELRLTQQKKHIQYIPDAIILDEKVRNSKVFKTQRTRWISAQYHYFINYFPKAVKELIMKGNVDFFNKAFQMMLPPRLLIPVTLFLGTIIALLLQNDYWIILWSIGFTLSFIAYVISIPKHLYTTKMLSAFLNLPKAVIATFMALLKLKSANKSFIHTPHN